MTITLTALQKQRRDTASNWTSNNTVLLAGEWGIESDTKKFKICLLYTSPSPRD